MRGRIAAFVLLVVALFTAWKPACVFAQSLPAIEWDWTYAYETDYSGRESTLGSELTIVGTVANFSEPFADFYAGGSIEYSFHISGLRSNGTVVTPIGSWTVYKTEYCGGVFVIYEDSTRDAVPTPLPPNTDVPSTFTDGTEFLVGVIPKLTVTYFYEGATYRGSNFDSGDTFPYQSRFTGGAQFDRVRHPDGSSCEVRFTGSWYTPPGNRPPGYTAIPDGRIDVTCAIFCNPCVTAELDANLIMDATCARLGGAINIEAGRFSPDSDVAVHLFGPDGAEVGSPYQLLHTDWCGAFSASIATMPAFQTGEYQLQAEDLATGEVLGPFTFHVMPVDRPSPPTNLRVTNLGTGTSLRIEWDASSSPHVTGYRLCRSRVGVPGTSGCWDLPSQPRTFADSGMERGIEFAYEVQSFDYCGAGPTSAVETGTPDYYPVLLVNGLCSDTRLWTDCAVPILGVAEVPDCQPAYANRLGDVLHQKGLSRVWVAGYDRNNRLYANVPAISSAIDAVLAATGEQKLNLIAHSQGGLICRSLLQTRPNYRGHVDNLVMLGTPNHGSALANLAAFNIFAGPFSVLGKIRTKIACMINTDAVYDLVPGSAFLHELNYGVEPCGESHLCDTYLLGSCGSHEPEDLPRDETANKPDYWLLAGTGQWCGLGRIPVNGLIGCTPNDGAVALASARLEALPSDRWTTDEVLSPSSGALASHFAGSAGSCHVEEARYGEFADAVYRVLTGADSPLTPVTAPPDVRPTPTAVSTTSLTVADSLETSFLPSIVGTLAAGITRRDTVGVDSVAEATFLQSLEMLGATTLELVSPSGQRVTPADTVSGTVRFARDEDLALQELTVVGPEPGPWIVESVGSGSSQGFELFPSVLASAALRLSIPSSPLMPGGPVLIQAWLHLPLGPDPTAAITGRIVAPDSSLATLAFHDDGVLGDGVAGDGIFGATYVPNVPGIFGILAEGFRFDGGGASLSRARTAAFVVESLPDLAVFESDIVVNRMRPGGPSDSLFVTATVHNLGGVDAVGGKALFLNSVGGVFHSEPLDIEAGSQTAVTAIWTPTQTDLDTLTVVADANFAFLQQRHDNDSARVVLSPDLVAVERVRNANALSLAAGYPNPAGARATISFAVPRKGHVNLQIYDVAGRLVRTLVDGTVEAGPHSTIWDSRSNGGVPVPSGVYFYQLRAEGRRLERRVVIVR